MSTVDNRWNVAEAARRLDEDAARRAWLAEESARQLRARLYRVRDHLRDAAGGSAHTLEHAYAAIWRELEGL